MTTHILNIINRIKQYSTNLEKKEIFIDKPWVLCNNSDSKVKYIFRRNNDLLISVDGIISICKWELLNGVNSLYVDRTTDKILLNNLFVNDSIMVLSLDGLTNEQYIFVNEQKIPNLNYEKYLQNLFYKKNNITAVKLTTGEMLEVYKYENTLIGLAATINGEIHDYIEVETIKTGSIIQIKNGYISKVLAKATYETNKGTIIIIQDAKPYFGDRVFQNGKPAQDGVYKIGIFKKIEVRSGIIIKW